MGVSELRLGGKSASGTLADVAFARACAHQSASQIQAQRQRLEIVGIRSADAREMARLAAGLLVGPVVDFAALLHLSLDAANRALRAFVRAGRVTNPSRRHDRVSRTG